MTRRSYKGSAVATTLAANISSGDGTLVLTDGSTFPSGSAAPFVVTVGVGSGTEEKILVDSRTGNTLTVSARGWDGTVAATHAAGVAVAHTFSATDADEANAHVNATAGVHGLGGTVVGTTDTQTLANKHLAASCSLDPTLLGVAWTAFTPASVSNVINPVYSACRYQLLGKALSFTINVTGGSTTAARATVGFQLPTGLASPDPSPATGYMAVTVMDVTNHVSYIAFVAYGGQTRVTVARADGALIPSGTVFNSLVLTGHIEVA